MASRPMLPSSCGSSGMAILPLYWGSKKDWTLVIGCLSPEGMMALVHVQVVRPVGEVHLVVERLLRPPRGAPGTARRRRRRARGLRDSRPLHTARLQERRQPDGARAHAGVLQQVATRQARQE